MVILSVKIVALNTPATHPVRWDVEAFLRTTGEYWEIALAQYDTILTRPKLRVRVKGFVGTGDDWAQFKDNLTSYIEVKDIPIECIRIQAKTTLSRARSIASTQ